MSMICDITPSLEANSGLIHNLHKCDVESTHTLRTDFTVKYETSCVQ